MNPYEELGVPKTANKETVKRAYRKKAQKLHPDKGGDAAAFRQLLLAYKTLEDDASRAKYDQTGEMPSEHTNDEQALATQTIVQTFNSVVGQILLRNGNPLEEDVLAGMIKLLDEKNKGITQQKKDPQRIAKTFKAMLGRFVREGKEENLMESLVQAQLSQVERALLDLDNQLAFGKKLVAMLKEYRYKVDPKTGKSNTSMGTLFGAPVQIQWATFEQEDK